MNQPILSALRNSILKSSPIVLSPLPVSESDISNCEKLNINSEEYDLDSITIPLKSGREYPLRAVYNAWINRSLSTAEYISSSQLKKIPIINFADKTYLIDYLQGKISDSTADDKDKKLSAILDSSSSIVKDKSTIPTSSDQQALSSELLKAFYNENETPLLHQNLFQGDRLMNFKYLIKDAQLEIVNKLSSKNSTNSVASRHSTSRVSKNPSSSTTNKNNNKNKNDSFIIILSPSSSALIQMQNVKQFLQNGQFIDPSSLAGTNNADDEKVVIIKKTLPTLGERKFLIVNSTDFFTKSDYWNRVVAIFTTGQTWQFKNYITENPDALFKKFKGYNISYDGDVVNKNIYNWNVESMRIDRNRRFNDKEISESFWESLERAMIKQGITKS